MVPKQTLYRNRKCNNALMLLPQEFVAGDGTAENTGAYLTISCKIYQVLADGTTKIYLHGDAEAFAPITVGISSALCGGRWRSYSNLAKKQESYLQLAVRSR